MVCERAELDREEFDRRFAGKDDCAAQIFDFWRDFYLRQIWSAYESQAAWRDGLRAAGYASAGVFDHHPRETRFCLVEMTRAGNVHQAKVELILRSAVEMIDAGRQQLEDPESISRSTAEWVAGSFMQMALKRLSESPDFRVRELVPELMYTAVRPYLGEQVALEELAIPPPADPQDLGGESGAIAAPGTERVPPEASE
jgi:AcrR family transcriptional regulator